MRTEIDQSGERKAARVLTGWLRPDRRHEVPTAVVSLRSNDPPNPGAIQVIVSTRPLQERNTLREQIADDVGSLAPFHALNRLVHQGIDPISIQGAEAPQQEASPDDVRRVP